jgi:hypothetical protein
MMQVDSFPTHAAQVSSSGRESACTNQQKTANAVKDRMPVTTPSNGMATSQVMI